MPRYDYTEGPQHECGRLSWQAVEMEIRAGTILSLGIRNEDFSDNAWVSQMFVYPGGKKALWQVVNGGVLSTVTWWPYMVLDLQAAGAPDDGEPAVQTTVREGRAQVPWAEPAVGGTS